MPLLFGGVASPVFVRFKFQHASAFATGRSERVDDFVLRGGTGGIDFLFVVVVPVGRSIVAVDEAKEVY